MVAAGHVLAEVRRALPTVTAAYAPTFLAGVCKFADGVEEDSMDGARLRALLALADREYRHPSPGLVVLRDVRRILR